MLKLDKSMPQAQELAAKDPDRYQASKNGWVTIRFSAEKPFLKSIWTKWLKESFALAAQL